MKAILVFLLLTASTACAQPFSIVRQAIAGGGGISTNGPFALTGTIGAHDVGRPLAGGNFSLAGGFWSHFIVVQTSGAPLLSLAYAGNSAIISWALPAEGFQLESNPALSVTDGWTPVLTSKVTNNGVVSVTLPVTPGNHFYRLRKP